MSQLYRAAVFVHHLSAYFVQTKQTATALASARLTRKDQNILPIGTYLLEWFDLMKIGVGLRELHFGHHLLAPEEHISRIFHDAPG